MQPKIRNVNDIRQNISFGPFLRYFPCKKYNTGHKDINEGVNIMPARRLV